MNSSTFAHIIIRVVLVIAVLSGIMLGMSVLSPETFGGMNVVSGITFTVSLLLFLYLWLNPDSVRARQSNTTLKIASETLACLQDGFDIKSAQKICRLLLPATGARAVAITNREHIMGYAGLEEDMNPGGAPIKTKATKATLEDGQTRILRTPEAIGFPPTVKSLRAGIIMPLHRGKEIVGTLKFYYRRPREINETQVALAEGLAELLSTQISAVELETQTKLATQMELKALQSQINPHFLFNTINTIASLTRTDPDRARMLLREFAIFYRRTLENQDEFIELSREVEQTMRYFTFEVARFGEDRLELEVDIEDDLESMMIPTFMIQPIVENAVKHAMPQEGKLTVQIKARSKGDDVIIEVIDDGVGMEAEERRKMLRPEGSKGLGIAMRNINDRLHGYFGDESHMDIESMPGNGTTIRLYLKDALIED